MALSKGFSSSAVLPAAVRDRTERLPTLLFVDDEQEIVASLADLFRHNYHVVTATSADEALVLLKQYNVSVIVADQRMPGKTGSEFLAEACKIDADIVRIILTGYADIEAVIQAVNEGQIFFYLTKPWRNNELETVIGKAMEHHLLLRDKRRLVDELRRINAELEERVKERTLELEQRTLELEQHALELEEANRIISEMAYLDTLTNVANRRSLKETLAKEIDRAVRLNLPLTIILVDVDYFKQVNDTFGHTMGDKVLQAIAQTLVTQCRQYDLVGRYGGEEFLILMPGVALQGGQTAAERFRVAISKITIDDFPQQVTASFGVASLLPGQAENSLFERVDKALYRAKENGRNRVELDNNVEAYDRAAATATGKTPTYP